ncbi:hypothetical protein HLRTI_003457 [Halorhabdus tiamatea SARL4B]|uniref:Uncharacterized protein n=1 Tax=Halorhabdus tiamatea SARL4B TaxID=1033806 RepID=U2F7P9_9EURY|nr:hypothetical protein HLRTI_003457 [Halorhabdus tiamatea SARL4B]
MAYEPPTPQVEFSMEIVNRPGLSTESLSLLRL